MPVFQPVPDGRGGDGRDRADRRDNVTAGAGRGEHLPERGEDTVWGAGAGLDLPWLMEQRSVEAVYIYAGIIKLLLD